jgi:hypothetical protein
MYFPPEFLRLFDGPSRNIMDIAGANVDVCATDDFAASWSAWARWQTTSTRGTGVQDRLPEPALRLQRHRRPRRDVLRADPGRRYNQGMGDVDFGKIYCVYFPPEFLRLFDGPSFSIMDMTDMGACTTDDFTECMGALVYYIDPEDEGCKAYPSLLIIATSSTAAAWGAPRRPWPSVATWAWTASSRQDLQHLLPSGVPAPIGGPSCNIMDVANVGGCTADDFMECMGAPVYYVDPENGQCKVLASSTASPSAVGPRAAHGRSRPRRRPVEPGVTLPGAGESPQWGARVGGRAGSPLLGGASCGCPRGVDEAEEEKQHYEDLAALQHATVLDGHGGQFGVRAGHGGQFAE